MQAHRPDLLSLEELARSLASLEDGSDAAVDAAARTGALRELAAQVRLPSSRAGSEQFDGLRAQLLDALLRGDSRAATVAAAAAADASWALGGITSEDAHRQIDVTQFLAASASLRCLAPNPKRKHEGTDSPMLVSRPKLPSSELCQTAQRPVPASHAAPPHAAPVRFVGQPSDDEHYDADDDGSDCGCDLFDEPLDLGHSPLHAASHGVCVPHLVSFTLRPGAQPPAPPELPDVSGAECQPWTAMES